MNSRVVTVVGLDAFPEGWIGAIWLGPGHAPHAVGLKSLQLAESTLPPETRVVAVDIPLGLLDVAVRGGRRCDQHARQMLGPSRSSSVFSPPARSALAANSHKAASEVNRRSGPDNCGLSIQSFAIFPKLLDADKAVATSVWLQDRVIEVHPEVCFRNMAGSAIQHAKKRVAGQAERRLLLASQGFAKLEIFEQEARRIGARIDDMLDACGAAWSAWRYAAGSAKCLPADAAGAERFMRIWY